VTSSFADILGYDPKTELKHWQGTPIPSVHNPLKSTPRLWSIAQKVWWNGPPWTILRNSSYFLWHVMDYGRTKDIRYALSNIPEQTWMLALDEARPGLLSRGSYVFWSLAFDRIAPADSCDWPDSAHRLDHRPLRRESRERMRMRQRRVKNVL